MTEKIQKHLRDLHTLYYFYKQKNQFHMSDMGSRTSNVKRCKTMNFDPTCSYESYDIRSLSGQTGQVSRFSVFLVVWIAIDFTEVAKDARSIILERKKVRVWGNTKVTKVIQIAKNTKVRKRRSPKGKRN